MMSNHLLFTQKSTGMPPIGQYFHFFFKQFGVKLSKDFFQIKYGRIFQNCAQNGKKVFCCQIVNFQRISKILFAKLLLWSYMYAYFEFFKFKMAIIHLEFLKHPNVKVPYKCFAQTNMNELKTKKVVLSKSFVWHLKFQKFQKYFFLF
jgi:hypothetical protein